jgi:hypothetical protein
MKTNRIWAALSLAFALLCSGAAMAQQAGISSCAGGTLAVTSSSANVLLSTCGPVVIVYNISSQEAFYAFGTASTTVATAQTTSTAAPIAGTYSLPGNNFVTLNISNLGTAAYLAAITATSTATLRIVQGYALP